MRIALNALNPVRVQASAVREALETCAGSSVVGSSVMSQPHIGALAERPGRRGATGMRTRRLSP
jgi:hypothetical protein